MCTHERLAHLQLCLLSRKLFRVEMEGLQRGAGLIRCATALAALAALPCDLHFAHPEPLADKAEGPPCRLPVSVAICLPSTKEATKKGPCLRQGHEKHPDDAIRLILGSDIRRDVFPGYGAPDLNHHMTSSRLPAPPSVPLPSVPGRFCRRTGVSGNDHGKQRSRNSLFCFTFSKVKSTEC